MVSSRKSLLFVCLVSVCLLIHARLSFADEDDQKLPIRAGLQLSQSKQTLAGIKTQLLVSSHYQPEFQASAQVLDLQPLLNLREQYFAAQTEMQAANSALGLTQQAINRVQELYRNGVNSQRQLQEQQMAHSAAQARLNSSRYRLQSIQENLLANWGEIIGAWATGTGRNSFSGFINGQQALLLLSVPTAETLPVGTKQVMIAATGDRQVPQPAQFIANAPQGSELGQGETYFFKTSRSKLRTGMRVSAWISSQTAALAGFTIPSAALIWHAGQPTIYLKTAPEHFQRFTFKLYHPIAQGYFVAEPFPPNAEVVILGSQTLLSQEFQGLIQAEDDDGGD